MQFSIYLFEFEVNSASASVQRKKPHLRKRKKIQGANKCGENQYARVSIYLMYKSMASLVDACPMLRCDDPKIPFHPSKRMAGRRWKTKEEMQRPTARYGRGWCDGSATEQGADGFYRINGGRNTRRQGRRESVGGGVSLGH
jgi:hypothetical protein